MTVEERGNGLTRFRARRWCEEEAQPDADRSR